MDCPCCEGDKVQPPVPDGPAKTAVLQLNAMNYGDDYVPDDIELRQEVGVVQTAIYVETALLVTDLAPFLSHTRDCKIRSEPHDNDSTDLVCDCGLSAAIRKRTILCPR